MRASEITVQGKLGRYTFYEDACNLDLDYLAAQDLVQIRSENSGALLDAHIALFYNNNQRVWLAESILRCWQPEHAERLDAIINKTICWHQKNFLANILNKYWRPEHKERFARVFKDLAVQVAFQDDDEYAKSQMYNHIEVMLAWNACASDDDQPSQRYTLEDSVD
jgi:hypothetical protein